MSQNFALGCFKCTKNTFQFNKGFIGNCIEDNDLGYFLEVDVQILKNYIHFIMFYTFSLKE